MLKRILIIAFVVIGFAVAILVAARNAIDAAVVPIASIAQGNVRLLFDTASWLIWAAVAAGVLAGGLARRRPDAIEGARVLRHDSVAISEHWSHALATLLLVGSGIALGARFLPAFVSGMYQAGLALNLHYVGVVVFCFGATFYATNALLTGRWKGHMPRELGSAVKSVFAHYKALFGGADMPPEDKYFASEHLTYPVAVTGSTLMLLTGLIKVAAHSVDIPAWLIGPTFWIHDITAVVLGLFLVAHALMGALVPWSWPLLQSMFTGYVSADYAEHHHGTWYAQLKEAGRK